jgi:hypothetical protein
VSTSFTFDSDGFSFPTTNTYDLNYGSGDNLVAWCWKAGGSPVTNNEGSVSAQVSANTTAGFSVIKFTGTGSSISVGHGLNKTPDMLISHGIEYADNWRVAFSALGNWTTQGTFHGTDAFWGNSGVYNSSPTSTLVYGGTEISRNGQQSMIYAFHNVDGFSRFGKYTGNGSSDGPFVYTGFRPAFVVVKRVDSANMWVMMDSERYTYNVMGSALKVNDQDAEFSWNPSKDFLSNGFKLRTTDGAENASGGTYVYMAFAEDPFKYSNAR